MSWTCVRCQSQVDPPLVVCWNCGASVDGDVDEEFQLADDYEPEVPTANPKFGILGIAKLMAAIAMIFSFARYPDYLTFPLAVAGVVWIFAQGATWLVTERFFAWQRKHRRTRDAGANSNSRLS